MKYFQGNHTPTYDKDAAVLALRKAGLRPPARCTRGSLWLGHRFAATALRSACARQRVTCVGRGGRMGSSGRAKGYGLRQSQPVALVIMKSKYF